MPKDSFLEARFSPLLDLVDMLAVPSRFEGFATIVLEAWSMNLPVVASNVDGMGEYIEHGSNGTPSDIGGVGGLVKNLRTVLDDAHLRT